MARGAGARRHRFTVETRDTETLDALNAPNAKAWSYKGKAWGSLMTVSAKKLLEAGKTLGEFTHEVMIAWPRYTITIEDRLLLGTRTFYIKSPPENVEGLNKTMALLCQEEA